MPSGETVSNSTPIPTSQATPNGLTRKDKGTRVRYGYKRIHMLLKRERIHTNKKRIHRLYCLEGLQLRPKRPRRHDSASHRQVQQSASKKRNEAWVMDFVADKLHDGSKLRILTVVDTYTLECLAAEHGFRLNSGNVVDVLSCIPKGRGLPKRIHCDNSSEFSGRVTGLWAYNNKVTFAFSTRKTDKQCIH